MLSIKQTESGYGVFDDNVLLKEYKTNKDAWRALDKSECEPINKSEQTSDWFFNKDIKGL